MQAITGERVAYSQIVTAGNGTLETDEIDFDLSANQGIVINTIEHQGRWTPTAADEIELWFGAGLSLDKDETAFPTSLFTADCTHMDSAFVMIRMMQGSDTADDAAGAQAHSVTSFKREVWDWRMANFVERPKAINNLIHMADDNNAVFVSLITVRYHIVNFSLQELGILNAYRRF